MKNTNENAKKDEIAKFAKHINEANHTIIKAIPAWVYNQDLQNGIIENRNIPKIMEEMFHKLFNDFNLTKAITILGKSQVLTAKTVCEAWNLPIPETVPIRYSESTLKEKAEENEHGECWGLIYIIGLTIREQFQSLGIRPNNNSRQIHFYDNANSMKKKEDYWYFKKEEDFWANKKPTEAGNYLLINFKGKFKKMTQDEQNQKLKQLDKKSERMNPHVFSEAIISVKKITEEDLTNKEVGERFSIRSWYHWSSIKASDGRYVIVGGGFGLGLFVVLPRENTDSDLLLSASRKFDF